MGISGILRSPRAIGMIVGGLALSALVLSWWARGRQIDALEAHLALCRQQRAEIVATNKRMTAAIERRNAAARTAEAAAKRAAAEQARLADEARARASALEEALGRRLAAIPRTEVPATIEETVKQCERARSYLVR